MNLKRATGLAKLHLMQDLGIGGHGWLYATFCFSLTPRCQEPLRFNLIYNLDKHSLAQLVQPQFALLNT